MFDVHWLWHTSDLHYWMMHIIATCKILTNLAVTSAPCAVKLYENLMTWPNGGKHCEALIGGSSEHENYLIYNIIISKMSVDLWVWYSNQIQAGHGIHTRTWRRCSVIRKTFAIIYCMPGFKSKWNFTVVMTSISLPYIKLK